MPTTAERLGHPADAKLLIVNGDDIGMCHAANVATVEGLRNGVLTSASLMVPCPWALEVLRMFEGLDVGVHLTFTAEWATYRWGPLTAAARDTAHGLVDPEGYCWRNGELVREHANLDVIRDEARAQIEWALARGLEITGLDDHMGVFAPDPAYLSSYIDLARHYRLPVRILPAELFIERGHPDLAAIVSSAGPSLMTPDHLAGLPLQNPEALEAHMVDSIRRLQPGVTEFILHAATPGDELTAIAPDASARVEAHRLVTTSEPVRQALKAEGVMLIGYRELREALRAGA